MSSTKRNLMNQFLEPKSCESNCDNSKDQAMDDDSGPNFGKNLLRQESDPLVDNLLSAIEKRGSGKILPPQLDRGYSFSKPDSEMDYSDPSLKNIFQGLQCKKNLFGDDNEENKNPNFDISMSSSPEKGFKAPIDCLLDDLSKNSKTISTDSKPENFKRKWNKGDIIFKGKYSSGVTPKYERPVLKIKSRGNKRKRTDLDEMDQELSSIEKEPNPFLNITPQMKRKVRK